MEPSTLGNVAEQGTFKLLLCEASTGIVLCKNGCRWSSVTHAKYEPHFESLAAAEAMRDELLRRHPFAEIHLSRMDPDEHLGCYVSTGARADAYEHELSSYLRWREHWWRRVLRPKPTLTFEYIIELDRRWRAKQMTR